MKSWSKEIEIDAPIEQIWKLFNGSLEEMQKIMPQVVDNQPIKITEDMVGSVYAQKYKEGKRIMEYNVETLAYLDSQNEKKVKIGFTIAKMFEITAQYELVKLDDHKTFFKYTTTNKPLKWFLKLFLLFSTDKVVIEFVDRVKKVAESENR
ncbi:SRPBCC family protein [Sporosarcina sp. FA9]|uniref:SRPBCC family protein n=1 Tax=Sporosarcina sp. FA9 TaxID=3413030 RepID=UPI003F655137